MYIVHHIGVKSALRIMSAQAVSSDSKINNLFRSRKYVLDCVLTFSTLGSADSDQSHHTGISTSLNCMPVVSTTLCWMKTIINAAAIRVHQKPRSNDEDLFAMLPLPTRCQSFCWLLNMSSLPSCQLSSQTDRASLVPAGGQRPEITQHRQQTRGK